ncbi:RNA polymerase sigma factor [Steroidobacter sp.]|uniref:RNA polymerase sigma factor n=1 Tax=Steroidobacter sp. TaxID=1978227 RepID=UPI001A54A19C|nr:sigma-70 family RNA polymerase sigma factor [Steroidobacter sp.]MBL8271466.1 sigma-70 family RNA polymerase sigma factor [Steroidobacter sp.]
MFESNPAPPPDPEPVPTGPEPQARAELIDGLFREHNDALVRFLIARLYSQQEAKEVAQEAYVRLLQLDQLGTVSYLRAFLFKIAANLAADRLRARYRESTAVQARLFDQLHETLLSPDREVAGAEELGLLNRLILELPPKCRQVFLLHRIHGVQLPDIARQLNITERMVRKHVMRALIYCKAGLDAASKG